MRPSLQKAKGKKRKKVGLIVGFKKGRMEDNRRESEEEAGELGD